MGSEGFVHTVWETSAAQKFGGYTVVSTYSLDKHIAPFKKIEKHKSVWQILISNKVLLPKQELNSGPKFAS